jgi:hypothetical protein
VLTGRYLITFRRTFCLYLKSKYPQDSIPHSHRKWASDFLIKRRPLSQKSELDVHRSRTSLRCTSSAWGILTKFKDIHSFCNIIHICTVLSLSIYRSTALCWALAAFSVSWTYTQSVGLLGRLISPSQGLYPYIKQHKRRINAHRHPCLEWDSKPRSQCLSGRIQFMP